VIDADDALPDQRAPLCSPACTLAPPSPRSRPPASGTLVREAHDSGGHMAELAQLLAQRPTLGHELAGENGIIRRGERTRHARDRGLEGHLVEGGANGGANSGPLARFGGDPRRARRA
jgi:hypothetical protein